MGKLVNVLELLDEQKRVQEEVDNERKQGIVLPEGEAASGMGVEEIVQALRDGATHIHYFSDGSWNMHNLLEGLLAVTGQACLAVSTYSVSETAALTIARLKADGTLMRIDAVIDNRVETRTAGSLQLLRETCDRLVLVPCHAKVTVLHGIERALVVVGSANYTENKRIEVGVITVGVKAMDFHTNWIFNAIEKYS